MKAACWFLLAHPLWLVRRWHWKAACLSALFRGFMFFGTNLSAGLDAAVAAFVTESLLRATTAGFYGATTQVFRRVEPARTAALATSLLLPGVSHSVELLTHWARGTPELCSSLFVSVAFTLLSTRFSLFAMRHNVMVVGDGSQSLWADLRQTPRLLLQFFQTR